MDMVRLRVNSQVCGWNPGDVVEVVRSKLVDGLIRNEYVTVLAEHVPATPAADASSPEFVLPKTIKVPAELVGQLAEVKVHHGQLEPEDARVQGKLSAAVTVVPALVASRKVWAEFLDGQEVVYPADATRAQLLAAWKEHQDKTTDL